MATFFKNKVIKDVGKQAVEVYTTGVSTKTTVIGLALCNLTASVISVSILISDDTSVTGYYLKDVLVPPNSTLKALNGGEKLVFPATNVLYAQSNIDASLDVIMSQVEIV